MNDDILKSATKALRADVSDESGSAAATRMRIVGTVRAERRRKVMAVRASVLLLAAAIGGTAWAAATGRFPTLVQLLGEDSNTNRIQTMSGDSKRSSENRGVEPGVSPQVAVALPPVDLPDSVSASKVDVASGAGGSEVNSGPRPSVRFHTHSKASSGSTSPPAAAATSTSTAVFAAAPTSSANESAPAVGSAGTSRGDSAADALYHRAHALHFQVRNCTSAVTAWEVYLAAAPSGRFATFARYNRALCLARLGQTEEAKKSLTPFAVGEMGGYRKDEAKSLLNALSPETP